MGCFVESRKKQAWLRPVFRVCIEGITGRTLSFKKGSCFHLSISPSLGIICQTRHCRKRRFGIVSRLGLFKIKILAFGLQLSAHEDAMDSHEKQSKKRNKIGEAS